MKRVTEAVSRKVPVVTERAVTESKSLYGGTMWAVLARRTVNKGSRYERSVDLPIFYMDPRVQGITNRAHARRIAGEILGVDTPGVHVNIEVHLV